MSESAATPMCDEPITKTAAEWGRELLAAERLVRERVARAIEAAALPAGGSTRAYFAAIARDENR